ncbi:MAG: hypothetical protein WC623_06630 [Pedobacter sp.]|uniref:hypothetical protein n=1 Tax=Pedobacter sp. TaxID=1411316 RepID=UPI003567D10C
MRKIVFRFWLVNVVLSLVLFMLYRVVIDGLVPAGTSFLERFFNFMDVLINLGYSLIYLAVMIAGSLFVFLNQIDKVKRSYFLSFLTFSAVPLVWVGSLGVNVLMGFYEYRLAPAGPLIIPFCFSIIYLVCTVLEFLIFRKVVKNTDK